MFSSGNSGIAKPSAYQNALGVQTYRASSSESARPVPYLAGKQRIAVTFISDVFDTKAKGVDSGGKSSTRTGYNYYASFVGLACGGPVDALHAIFLNGDPVYSSNTPIVIQRLTSAAGTATAATVNNHHLTTGDNVVIVGAEQAEYNGSRTITVTDGTHFTYEISGAPKSPATTGSDARIFARVLLPPVFRDEANPDYVDVTIPDYGVMRLYWGTETQLVDDYLSLKSGGAHPAYRGLCYAVFHQLFLGFNQTNVQNVELVLARYPTSIWLDQRNINDDANAVAVAADLLQNARFGTAVPDTRLDTASLLATADLLDDEELGISPLITRDQELRQPLQQILEYIDAFPVFDTDGKFAIALARPSDDELPEITDSDLLEKPSFTLEDWTAIKNETRIRFSNRLLEYKEDAIGRPDTGARNITGEASSQTVDRSWVTDETVARRMQAAMSRSAALPKLTGKLSLRKQSDLFAALLPGALFTIDYSQRDFSHMVFRVDKRAVNDPAKAEFTIEFHQDRSSVYSA